MERFALLLAVDAVQYIIMNHIIALWNTVILYSFYPSKQIPGMESKS